MQPPTHILLRAALYSSIAALLLVLTPATLAQQAPAPNPLAGPDAAATPAQPAVAAPSTQPGVMRFKRYAITDDQGFKGTEVLHGVMPVDWTVKGGVTWNMALGPPDLIRIHWGDPQDVTAFDLYPFVNFVWANPGGLGYGRYHPGQITPIGMMIKQTPKDAFDAFDKVIVQMYRPDLQNAHIVKKEKMPKVAKAIYDQINTDPNYVVGVAVGRETFEYDLNGQTVQEIVSGIVVLSTNKRSNDTIWSISRATSERAPKGGFDKLQSVNAIMYQSLEMNPAWNQQLSNLLQQRQAHTRALQQQQLAQQNAQFNAIESRISSQTAANDAEHASYWQHSADLNRQSENEADIQREVSPWKDSDGTTYKLPTQYGNAWSGADGQIIMNNDASYNPNSDPSLTPTTWTPMQQTQN
jgi:hypothetical protein